MSNEPFPNPPRLCEVCQQPATRAIHDASPDGSKRETHWRCSDHDRVPLVLANAGPVDLFAGQPSDPYGERR